MHKKQRYHLESVGSSHDSKSLRSSLQDRREGAELGKEREEGRKSAALERSTYVPITRLCEG